MESWSLETALDAVDSDVNLYLAVYSFTSAAKRCLDVIGFAICQEPHIHLYGGGMVLTTKEATNTFRNLHKLLRPHQAMDPEVAADRFIDLWELWREVEMKHAEECLRLGYMIYLTKISTLNKLE